MILDIRQFAYTPEKLRRWLVARGIKDVERGASNLRSIAELSWSDDEVNRFVDVLGKSLRGLPDPDRALNNIDRLVSTSDSLAKKTRELSGLTSPFYGLLTVLSDSQYLAEVLRDESHFDQIAKGQFQPVARRRLVSDATALISGAKNQTEAMRLIRQFKRSQTLRIAWGDLVLGHRFEQVAAQISFVASAICEAALSWCRRRLRHKFSNPWSPNGQCRFVILALGKLGGTELNFSSDIDLIAVFEFDGDTQSSACSTNQEYFSQLTRAFIRLVGHPTELGSTYRIDMRLRPNGSRGPICMSFLSTAQYYDLQGRTWERQAMIKARPIAGDLSLGDELLTELQPWIFRRSLSHADIEGIKALKRQIERKAKTEGDEFTDIKTGFGGIRDVEFVIQFMQLLNGWNLTNLRTANTIRAIGRLERSQCLTHEEAELLASNYRWLRVLEHRLQIVHDQQTHKIPMDETERLAVAKRIGIREGGNESTLREFDRRLKEVTGINRIILDHLLHGSFGTKELFKGTSESVSAEVDLVLDPHPSAETIQSVVGPYCFKDADAAYQILMQLAQEKTPFISSRRCKHFFASIAGDLLTAISKTPDSDRTLVALSTVSDSLGAKGVLWELFSESTSTLQLYVRLCASSDYLATILKANPGMVDELMDALQVDSLPTKEWFQQNLESLAHGATELDLILAGFKNSQHLRIGIRDILGHDDIVETHRALADVAEVCLQKVAAQQIELLGQKYGIEEMSLNEIPFVIVALGKLGGREPNYHSDVDVVFLHDSGSEFENRLPKELPASSFFSELAAAITVAIAKQDSGPRLYEIDSRLRPTGGSGVLSVNVHEFAKYFESGAGQLWERQALCKARAIFGPESCREQVMSAIRTVQEMPCSDHLRDDIWQMRLAMEFDCQPGNLKRGPGGTVDVEFAVQMLQLEHCLKHPEVLQPGTLAAIDSLNSVGVLSDTDAACLTRSYQILRSVESGLRLMNTTARHDLPEDAQALERLAYLLNRSSLDGQALAEEVYSLRSQVRQCVLRLFRIANPDAA